MEENSTYLVLTFPTTYAALRFDSVFKESALTFQLIPVPREISSSCGLAARIDRTNPESLLQFLSQKRVEFEELYCMNNDKQQKPQLLATGES
ncbi:MAG: DUF3343 domain-containing protein [bacterium]|jgi:hypothetical protein